VPRPGLDRERVVDAAAALADAEGLGAVTLARVAAGLGVRAPSLYHHVAGRDDLVARIALRAVGELDAALRAAAMGRAGPEALAAVAHAYRDYARRHPGRYATTFTVPADGDPALRAAAGEVVDVLLAVLRHWALEGDEAVHAVRVIRSAVHGFVALEAAGGFGLPLDRDASFDRLVATLTAGLPARRRSRAG
jgi:AcrR family transcriptional regulator